MAGSSETVEVIHVPRRRGRHRRSGQPVRRLRPGTLSLSVTVAGRRAISPSTRGTERALRGYCRIGKNEDGWQATKRY